MFSLSPPPFIILLPPPLPPTLNQNLGNTFVFFFFPLPVAVVFFDSIYRRCGLGFSTSMTWVSIPLRSTNNPYVLCSATVDLSSLATAMEETFRFVPEIWVAGPMLCTFIQNRTLRITQIQFRVSI